MSSHAYHYLCVYEKHTQRPLYLGRTKRIATGDQRLVLHGNDCASRAYLLECGLRREKRLAGDGCRWYSGLHGESDRRVHGLRSKI